MIGGSDLVLFPCLVVVLLELPVVASLTCPAGQIARVNDTICCVPVFNCAQNHEIEGCTGPDNNEDSCVPCNQGYINNHVTSSVDDSWTKYRCFEANTLAHQECPPEDTLPLGHSKENCALSCECDIYKCYYGNQCGCKRATPCIIGEELNTVTGECEACKAHTYKDSKGCQPCTWNETSWRLSHNAAVQPVEEVPGVIVPNDDSGITTLTTDGTSKYVIATGPKEPAPSEAMDKESEGGGVPVVPIIICIMLLVIGAIVVAMILVMKRKIRDGDTDSRLVVCYNKLTCKTGNHPVPQTENIEEAPPAVHVNGNGVEKPKQAVPPMQQEVTHTEEDSIPFAEMSLNTSANCQNESTVPLMSSESNGDATTEPADTNGDVQELTETKSS